MKSTMPFTLIVILLAFMLAGMGTAVSAQEPLPTATPDPDGIIYIQVQPGDTLSGIAFRAGITLDELRALNGLTGTDFIQAGQLLIVGIVTPTAPPFTPTPAVSPTPTSTRPPPTPSSTPPPPPRTAICLRAFIDANGNGVFDAGEVQRADVAFTIYTSEGVIANIISEDLPEPYCIEPLAAGEYQVTRSIGRDETLTTSGNRGVQIAAGDVVLLEFGSFTGPAPTSTPVSAGGETAVNAPTDTIDTPVTNESETGVSAPRTIRPIWVTAGIILVLMLGGVALWLRRPP